MPRMNIPIDQFFDRNGAPLEGGFLYTRETDGTTAKATYPTQADLEAQTNANDNPIVLDDEGRAADIFGSGDFWLNLEDKNNVQIPEWPKSPVSVGDSDQVPNLFSGLGLSNNSTDPNHDIDIAVGSIQDSLGTTRIDIATAITKQIDATWTAGTDNGGLAGGLTLSASTWYHIFAVVVGGSSDVMFDTSVACANGVANNAVTQYAYINSVLTDGSADIIAFINNKNKMWLDVPVNNENQSNPGATATDVTLTTPLGIITLAEISAIAVQGASGMGNIIIRDKAQTATTPTATLADIGASTSQTDSINKQLLTDTSSAIEYQCSTGTDGTMIITTLGWEILR